MSDQTSGVKMLSRLVVGETFPGALLIHSSICTPIKTEQKAALLRELQA